MSKPKISVIIPIYNSEKFLERCLNSVINQTLQQIEIICIDDESTDNSLSILRKFMQKDRRIRVVSQQNQGAGSARNCGLNMAVGEYCGFIDSDDWIDLDYFEKLYAAAKKYNADIACCGITREYSTKKRVKLDHTKEKVAHTVHQKFAETGLPNNCYVYNKIYRRSALNAYKISFPRKCAFEDIAFSLNAVYFLRDVVTVPQTTYHYWVNHESITRHMTDFIRQDRLIARDYFIKFARKHHINSSERYFVKRKVIYKFCGVPLMKIYVWETKKEYHLFSLFKIFEKLITL